MLLAQFARIYFNNVAPRYMENYADSFIIFELIVYNRMSPH